MQEVLGVWAKFETLYNLALMCHNCYSWVRVPNSLSQSKKKIQYFYLDYYMIREISDWQHSAYNINIAVFSSYRVENRNAKCKGM